MFSVKGIDINQQKKIPYGNIRGNNERFKIGLKLLNEEAESIRNYIPIDSGCINYVLIAEGDSRYFPCGY